MTLKKGGFRVFSIRIAELVVRIDNRYDYVREFCGAYIVADELPADITVSATEEEIRRQIGDIPAGENDAQKQQLERYAYPYGESLCIYRHIAREMIRFDGFLMHAAVIAVDGEAYAFAAKSGTGKTTHMKLWLETFGERAQVINGDKPILRYIDGTLYAFGTPWCGSEGMGHNAKAPLRALCFIERSETNSIAPMASAAVIGRIFHQLLMPQDEASLDRFMQMIENMIAATPCFLLRCNMEPEAALAAWRGIRGER